MGAYAPHMPGRYPAAGYPRPVRSDEERRRPAVPEGQQACGRWLGRRCHPHRAPACALQKADIIRCADVEFPASKGVSAFARALSFVAALGFPRRAVVHHCNVLACARSARRRQMANTQAVASDDKTVRIREIVTGGEYAVLKQQALISAVAFCPGGGVLGTAIGGHLSPPR